MRLPLSSIFSFLRGYWNGEDGATAAITAMFLVPAIGLAGFVIDLGNVFHAQRALQASTDASALAAAQDVLTGTATQATAVALQYSAASGQFNSASNLTATMVSGYPQFPCLQSTGITCAVNPGDPSGTSPRNAIRVSQQATVPMYFARIFGINSMTIQTTSTASARGGKSKLVDVMVVMDTTGSMNNPDTSGGNPPSCTLSGIPNPTRLDCATAGVRSLLLGLAPSGGQVGLMIFPGLKSTTPVTLEYDCNGTTPSSGQIEAYNNSPIYRIVSMTNGFRASDNATTLNAASPLVLALRGGGVGCTQGVSANGNTYFADAITAAQADLAANGRPNVQKAIILLGDGEPTASTSQMGHDQCHQAVAAAANAAASGTWIYSVAYRALLTRPSGCDGEPSSVTGCQTMKDIAVAEPTRFYSTTSTWVAQACTSVNYYSDLVLIFKDIGMSLQEPRILPDNVS